MDDVKLYIGCAILALGLAVAVYLRAQTISLPEEQVTMPADVTSAQ